MARGLKIADLAFLGRVGNQFGPGSYAGLEMWLKADSLNLADGTLVGDPGTIWTDQTVNGHDATESGAPPNPTFETNEVGTMPIVRFDSLQEMLDFPVVTLAGDFTIILVNKTNVGADTIWMGHDADNDQIRRNVAGNNLNYFDGTAFLTSSAFGSASNLLHVATVRRSGTTVSFRENKTARGTGVGSATVRLNTLCNNNFLGSGRGDLAELLVYSQHRSDAEVDALYDNYLKLRWTTLP